MVILNLNATDISDFLTTKKENPLSAFYLSISTVLKSLLQKAKLYLPIAWMHLHWLLINSLDWSKLPKHNTVQVHFEWPFNQSELYTKIQLLFYYC